MLVLFLFTLYHIAFVLAITSCYIKSRGEAGRGGGGGGGGGGGWGVWVGFGGGFGGGLWGGGDMRGEG